MAATSCTAGPTSGFCRRRIACATSPASCATPFRSSATPITTRSSSACRSCQSADQPAKYPPIKFGDYALWFAAQRYEHMAKAEALPDDKIAPGHAGDRAVVRASFDWPPPRCRSPPVSPRPAHAAAQDHACGHAFGPQGPRPDLDDRQHRAQSRLHGVGHAVRDGRKAAGPAADGRSLGTQSRPAGLHLHAARRLEVA